jgi:hypothetical protein
MTTDTTLATEKDESQLSTMYSEDICDNATAAGYFEPTILDFADLEPPFDSIESADDTGSHELGNTTGIEDIAEPPAAFQHDSSDEDTNRKISRTRSDRSQKHTSSTTFVNHNQAFRTSATSHEATGRYETEPHDQENSHLGASHDITSDRMSTITRHEAAPSQSLEAITMRQEAAVRYSKAFSQQQQQQQEEGPSMERATDFERNAQQSIARVLPNVENFVTSVGDATQYQAPRDAPESLAHSANKPVVYVRKHHTGKDVDRPEGSSITSGAPKLPRGWSPALYGEQSWELNTVLSDPLTTDTLRKDCLEIHHVLGQMTEGRSKQLPWFIQVEQYILPSSVGTMASFNRKLREKNFVETYVNRRCKYDADFAAVCKRVGPDPLFPPKPKRRRSKNIKVCDY